jgi:hypothetical protein
LVTGTILLWTGAAHALPAFSSALVPGPNTISDDSGEIFVDRDGSGTVSAGDRFIGIIGVTSLQPSTLIPGTDVNELTGLFTFEVLSVGATAPCAGVGLPSGCADFTFGVPTGGFNAALNDPLIPGIDWGPPGGPDDPAAFTGPSGALDPNTVFIAFEDETPDFNLAQTTIQDVIDTAVDGDIVAALGLEGGDVIGAFAPVAPGEIVGAPPGQGIGNISFVLSISDTTLPLDPTQPVTGTGNISAPFPTNPFLIRDDVTINVIAQQQPPIPEPGTLSLLGMGIGLLAFGAAVRRYRAD